jgi:hypothetical protein
MSYSEALTRLINSLAPVAGAIAALAAGIYFRLGPLPFTRESQTGESCGIHTGVAHRRAEMVRVKSEHNDGKMRCSVRDYRSGVKEYRWLMEYGLSVIRFRRYRREYFKTGRRF